MIVTVLQRILLLFFLMAVGYCVYQLKIVSAEGKKNLASLVLNVTLPAMILASVADVPASFGVTDIFLLLGLSFLCYGIMGIIAFFAPRILRCPLEERGLYSFMTLFGNVGFMGFPVLTVLFGSEAIFVAAILNLPMNLLCFSVGILMVAPRGTKLKASSLLTPTVIASVAAPILFLLPFSLPTVVYDGLSLLGSATVPLAMLVVGITLAQMPFRELWCYPRVYGMSCFRLLLCPLTVFLILQCFPLREYYIGILTVLAAMPAATNATLLCIEYKGNEKLASTGVCLSTLLSLFTIPLITVIL